MTLGGLDLVSNKEKSWQTKNRILNLVQEVVEVNNGNETTGHERRGK